MIESLRHLDSVCGETTASQWNWIMKFRELLIRFKRRLTYEDLAYLTNDAVSAVVQTEHGKKLLELGSVKDADDKWLVVQLNNRVAPILLAVSSVPSRRAQAQIFRKHMLAVFEKSETNNLIFNDKERLDFWLKHTYSEDQSIEEGQRGQIFIISWAFENLLAAVLTVIYRTQYEVTLGLAEFKDLHKGLVITNFELLLNTLMASDENIESKFAKSYLEFVSSPLLEMANSLSDRCAQAIIEGNNDDLQRLRAEATAFGLTYQQAIEFMKAST